MVYYTIDILACFFPCTITFIFQRFSFDLTASDPADTGLEDLHLDVKSKFELFESLKNQEDNKNLNREPIEVKRY